MGSVGWEELPEYEAGAVLKPSEVKRPTEPAVGLLTEPSLKWKASKSAGCVMGLLFWTPLLL